VNALKSRRALTLLAVLAPLVPLTVAVAAPARAESGARVCARWGTQNGKTVVRAIRMPRDDSDDLCRQYGMDNVLKQGLTAVQPATQWPWWDTCERFRDQVLHRPGTQDPCLGMREFTPRSENPQSYVATF
jgi:hypothetical protein